MLSIAEESCRIIAAEQRFVTICNGSIAYQLNIDELAQIEQHLKQNKVDKSSWYAGQARTVLLGSAGRLTL